MEVLGPFQLPVWLILAAAVGVLLYMYAMRYRNYWKEQNIPYENLSLFWGTTLQYLTKPSHLVEQDLYKKHGRLFGAFEDGKPALFVAEPDILKTVFVKDFSTLNNRMTVTTGDSLLDNMMVFAPLKKWKKLRSATTPAFTSGKLRKMNSLINACARNTTEYLKKAAEENRSENIKSVFGHYTLDVLSTCAFGTKLDTHSSETQTFVATAQKAFFAEITPQVVLQAFFQNMIKTLNAHILNKDTFHFFKRLTERIIESREKGSVKHDDFLQMMMNAKSTQSAESAEERADSQKKLVNIDSEVKPLNGSVAKGLTEEEAIAQCVLFYLGGQDTSSTTIAIALYLLALHPDAQSKLRQEVDDCFEKHGPSPSYDDISKLCYLNAVVSETLRLFPIGTRNQRTSYRSDYVLGDTGIKIIQNGAIIVPVYALHRDPEFFPDPDTFNPERFNEENIGSVRPYTYLPFGAGPRNCVGMRLALQVVKTSLLHVVHGVHFVPTSETKVPLEFRPGFGILHPKDITLGIRKRSS